jgi:hypothetical protein
MNSERRAWYLYIPVLGLFEMQYQWGREASGIGRFKDTSHETGSSNFRTRGQTNIHGLHPYINNTYGRLSTMLAKYNIKSVALSYRKIASYLPPVKDVIGLKTPGIYRIPCECGTVYNWTEWSIHPPTH